MSEAAPLAGDGLDCSLLNEDNNNYGLRIAALFAILGASTIGGCLPLITRRAKLGNLGLKVKIGTVSMRILILMTTSTENIRSFPARQYKF